MPPRRPDRAAHGKHKAAALAPSRLREARTEFAKLNTREARAAFADYWIGVWAEDSDYAWPMVYELLHIVEEDQLYADPQRVGPGAPGDTAMHGQQTYGSFAEYFEDRARQPFERWAELEQTYHYAQKYAPELFDGTYKDARTQVVAQRAKATEGKEINKADSHNPRPSLDIIKTTEGGKDGTNADYLTRRIARDHPDILARMKAGEFRSVRAAALEAGIVPRTISVPVDRPKAVARALTKHMTPENLATLKTEMAPEGTVCRHCGAVQ